MWIGEEKSLFSKLLLESGSVWIARECVPFSIPSFFWWEWNVKWQNPRQSPVCVSKARLIQDEFWACQAQLYQPRLTLTELKKENIKRKDWHKEIMSYESMCDLSIVNFLFWWKLYRLQAKKIMNKPAIVGELMLWTHQHTWYFWLFVSFYKITWLQRSPKHDPTCSAQSSPMSPCFHEHVFFLSERCPVRGMAKLEYGNGLPCSLFIEVKITLSHTVCINPPYATVKSPSQWGQSANWHTTVFCPRTRI